MILKMTSLNLIVGNAKYTTRKTAFFDSLNRWPRPIGRAETALILPQVIVESGGFRYVKEKWGPTAAQRRYEGREVLGNTQPGDGKRFMGRDFMQITGRENYRALTKWVRENMDLETYPDFEKNPDLLTQPDWLGIGVMWYWLTRVKQRHIDAGDVENISRTINGGRNGLTRRFNYYTRAALVLLGYGPDAVSAFQAIAGIEVDGIPGPHTRAALHKALAAKDALHSGASSPAVQSRPKEVHPPATAQPPDPVAQPPRQPKSGGGAGIVALVLALMAGAGLLFANALCTLWPWLAGVLSLTCGG